MKLLGQTYYLTISEYTRPLATLGFPAGTTLDTECLTSVFDDAVDSFGEAMKDGGPARVYEIAFLGGTIRDVTEEAILRIQEWCNQRKDDFPDWMTAPADDEGDAPEQRGSDAAREAADDRRAA